MYKLYDTYITRTDDVKGLGSPNRLQTTSSSPCLLHFFSEKLSYQASSEL